MKKWYCVPHTGKVDSYIEEGEDNNFPRGVFLAYSNCCLITGLDTEKEAKKALKKYPCEKHKLNII